MQVSAASLQTKQQFDWQAYLAVGSGLRSHHGVESACIEALIHGVSLSSSIMSQTRICIAMIAVLCSVISGRSRKNLSWFDGRWWWCCIYRMSLHSRVMPSRRQPWALSDRSFNRSRLPGRMARHSCRSGSSPFSCRTRAPCSSAWPETSEVHRL